MPRRSGFVMVGHREMVTRLKAIERRYPGETQRAMRLVAEEVLTEAKQKFVPWNLGSLSRSGRVGRVSVTGGNVEVLVSFGDDSAPYALAVHEHPSQHSPPSWRGKPIGSITAVRGGKPWNIEAGRGPKYLERPIKRAVTSGRFVARVVEAARRAVGL